MIIWHANGVYSDLYDGVNEGRAWLAVLYNLSLVAILAVTLGLLIEKVAAVITTTRLIRQQSTKQAEEVVKK